MPNAFSPNGDGMNDQIFPIQVGDATLLLFEIFNRWGERVFTGSGDVLKWDGTHKGKDEELGVYVYLLRFRDNKTNKEFFRKGNITLVR